MALMSNLSATNAAVPAIEKMAFKLSETAVTLGILEITVRLLVNRGLLRPCRSVRHLLFVREEISRILNQ